MNRPVYTALVAPCVQGQRDQRHTFGAFEPVDQDGFFNWNDKFAQRALSSDIKQGFQRYFSKLVMGNDKPLVFTRTGATALFKEQAGLDVVAIKNALKAYTTRPEINLIISAKMNPKLFKAALEEMGFVSFEGMTPKHYEGLDQFTGSTLASNAKNTSVYAHKERQQLLFLRDGGQNSLTQTSELFAVVSKKTFSYPHNDNLPAIT